MKKIFTLLCAVGLLTAAANAQPGSRDNRDKPQYDQKSTPQTGQWDKTTTYNNGRDMNGNNDRYSSSDAYGKSIDMQIAQINRKYDLQVQQVKNSFFMKRAEKTRKLRSLEDQRQQEIRMVYARAAASRNQSHDRGYDSNRRY